MSVVGPMVAQSDVEDAVVATIDYWADFYLGETERLHSISVPSIGRPASYNETYDYQNWPEGQLPGIAVTCKGTVNPLEYRGDRTMGGWYEVEVDAIVTDQTEAATRRAAALYQSMLATLLMQRRSLKAGGSVPFATDTLLIAEKPLVLPDANNRTLAVGGLMFHVRVDVILAAFGGPVDRPTPPDSPGAEWPEIETVDVTFSKLP